MTQDQATQNYHDSVRRIRAWHFTTFRRIEATGRRVRVTQQGGGCEARRKAYLQLRRTYRRAMNAAWRTFRNDKGTQNGSAERTLGR